MNAASAARKSLKTLFLQAPSFDGFDGGAGSRYQTRREVKSFWFPTWLAQPAALVPESRLLDAPADGLTVEQTLQIARGYDLVIIHTSTPSFPTDARFAQLLKRDSPNIRIGLVGAKTMVDPDSSLQATAAVDFVCREEFDYTCQELAQGAALPEVRGLSYRSDDGRIVHNLPRAMIENMDELPFVAPIYRRDLKISYPHLSKQEIFHSMEIFYRRFYFRPGKIWEIVREMLASWDMMKRRLREGVEFFRFLRAHEA